MRKVISLLGAFFMFFTCQMQTAEPVNTYVHIDAPDVVELLKDEIRCTQWNDRGKDTTLQISQEDAERLMKIAYAEGGTQGVKGQYLIMRVIINRLESDLYPDTIQEIIEQPHQFETWQNGMYEKAEPNADSHLALAKLESNKDPDEEIIGFETTSNGEVLTRWFDMAFTYLDHNFYKQKD